MDRGNRFYFVIISLFGPGTNLVKQADHNSPLWKGGGGLGVRARLGVEGRIYIFTDAGGSSQLSDFGQICNGFFSKVAPLYFVLVRSSMTV